MIKVLELFAGIGACSKALERLGIEHEIMDAVEIDKYAIKSFNAIHGTSFDPQDITKWNKQIDVDLIIHGSPCQDFSIAGKQAGGDKGSGTRSSLMYETLRIVKDNRPKYVIWENVKNLWSEKHRHNWESYVECMNDLGYDSFAKVLNAKNFGIPQNRERLFTISIRSDLHLDFDFPPPKPLDKSLKDVLETNVDPKYYIKDIDNLIHHNSYEYINGGVIGKMYNMSRMAYHDDYISPTIHTCPGGNTEPKVSIKTANTIGYDIATDGDAIDLQYPNSKTIMTSDSMAVVDGYIIRKFTPKECWRLMGFDDEDYEKAAKVNSNTQLYKQAGNSIVVNVLEAILTYLLEDEL